MPDADAKPRDSGEKSDQKKKKSKKNKTRELVECLLVAGALALGIRTFAFQLFKIPTRSMEPALIGNLDYGDRVVAAMWYKRAGFPHLTLAKPDRWQVIVFDHYVIENGKEQRTNFIKRLVGLPGERVEIRDGDIWVRKPGKDRAEIERKPPRVQERLWTQLCDLDFSEHWRVPYYWRTEPPVAEDQAAAGPQAPGWSYQDGALLGASTADVPAALRWVNPDRLDNRFIRLTVKDVECPNTKCPRRVDGKPVPRFKAVFDTARPVVFCPERSCRAPVWGVYDDGSPGELIKDNNSNAAVSNYWTERGVPAQVSDLRLELDFESLGGAGQLAVTLTGRSEPYVLTLDLASGAATLGGRQGVSGSGQVAPTAGRHRLVVTNVDGRFGAELDGQPVASCDYIPRPLPGNSNAEVVLSKGARVRLYGVKLARDLYYGWAGSEMHEFDPSPGGSNLLDQKASYIQMPQDGYLFLGDNQLASADGRSFGSKEGSKIVARAIFVAWPPSRSHLVW